MDTKIIKGALQGTEMMTLFSSLVSDAKKQQFTEPQLLAELIQRAFPFVSKKTTETEGRILHYAIGFFFRSISSTFQDDKEKAYIVQGCHPRGSQWLSSQAGKPFLQHIHAPRA